jgi:hypothetical protein
MLRRTSVSSIAMAVWYVQGLKGRAVSCMSGEEEDSMGTLRVKLCCCI